MKFFKYLKYLFVHKWFVFVECAKMGMPIRGFVHDWSKFLPSEFIPYMRFFYGKYPSTDPNSPNFVTGDGKFHLQSAGVKFEHEIEEDFDRAWLYHQRRNPHHWQYWVLMEDSGGVKVLKMPNRYMKEMLCDWHGAGRAITGKKDTANWYLANRHKIQLHPETRQWIEEQLGVNDNAKS